VTFVDTNYFLRIVQSDHKEHSKIAQDFFVKAAEKNEKCCSSLVVFFETYWLLNKHFHKVQTTLQNTLKDILGMEFIVWENEKVLKQAVYSMDKFNFDLEDAYNFHYAKSQKTKTFATFDKNLQIKWNKLSNHK